VAHSYGGSIITEAGEDPVQVLAAWASRRLV